LIWIEIQEYTFGFLLFDLNILIFPLQKNNFPKMVIVKLIALPLQRIEKRFNTEYFAASSRFPTKHQLSKASIKKTIYLSITI